MAMTMMTTTTIMMMLMMMMLMMMEMASPKQPQNRSPELSRGPFCGVVRAEREYGNDNPRA
eukprot:9825290-Alexandrium_andersonii.AAC.1